MTVKNFYLIETPKINALNKAEKDFLEQQLTIYHNHSSSVIDKAKAILALADNKKLNDLRFEYNTWLYKFINNQLKTVKTEKENETLKKILGNCYYYFGFKNYTEGNPKNALDNIEEAVKIGEKLNDSTSLFRAYFFVAFIFHINGNISNALKFYEKCLKLSRENVDKSTLAGLFSNLHYILKNRGDFAKSSNYIYRSLKIYKEINNECGIATIYNNIGCLLLSQLEVDEALKYFFAALKLSESVGHNIIRIAASSLIGSIHQEKDENDTALKYYLKVVNLPEINFRHNTIYYRIGTLYESQNQIDLAMDYYNKSLQLGEKTEYKELVSLTLSKIGALEIKRGNVEKANLHIKRAFKLAQELSYSEPIRDAAASKVLLAIAIKDYKLAYEMEKLKNEMKEKILNKDNTKEVIKHQLKYEYEKQLKQKDIEIEHEKESNQQFKAQIDLLLAKNKRLAYQNKIINEQAKQYRAV